MLLCKIKNYLKETEKIMKGKHCFLLIFVTLPIFFQVYAQSNYMLVFKHVDKQSFWLPINLPDQAGIGSIPLSTMKRGPEKDELLCCIQHKMDSCVVHKDTLLIYFNPTGLTVFLDTTTNLFYFEISGSTNLKRSFSLSIPSCNIKTSNINILIIESFVTQYTFVKKGKGRYRFIGSKDINLDLDDIRKRNLQIKFATIRL